MKKALILLISLIAVSSSLCFAGCNDKKDGGKADGVQTKPVTVDDENEDTCPDCRKHGMPKVRFDFEDGRPS